MEKTYEEILKLLGNHNLGNLSQRDKALFVQESNRMLDQNGEEEFVRTKAYALANWDYAHNLYGDPTT